MLRAVPFLLAAIAIVAFTYVEGSITDRWVEGNRPAEYCASLLDRVPNKIGDWEGVDQEVDDDIQKTAGAQGYVSRVYKHATNGRTVDVWLIVGHARDTAEHTPDTCYPSSGFRQGEPNATFSIEAPEQPTGTFWTAMFNKTSPFGVTANRVFWAWFEPTFGNEGTATDVQWTAPENARFHFGSTRALYKLYFTAAAADTEEAAEDSVCLEFAEKFLPVVNEILADANRAIPEGFVAEPADESA